MVMDPAGFRTKNYYASEDQPQCTESTDQYVGMVINIWLFLFAAKPKELFLGVD
jgi:hypothetical protein